MIYVGSGAFADCCGLVSVTIGNSVQQIGDEAFFGCRGLTSVTIPDSVSIIGSSAFAGCSGLTNVTIGNGVTSIHDNAFFGCTGLTSVTIPNSVTGIGAKAFADSGLTSIVFKGDALPLGNYPLAEFPLPLNPSCTVYVRKDSEGWDVEIPGHWLSYEIRYLTPEIEIGLANERGAGIVELNADELPDTVEVASGVTLVVKGDDIVQYIERIAQYAQYIEEIEIELAMLEEELAMMTEEMSTNQQELDMLKAEIAYREEVLAMFKAEANFAMLTAKVIPIPHEEGQNQSLFKVKPEAVAGGVSLAVVLDEDAVKPDETAAEVVAGANMAAIDSAAEGANVSVKLSGAKQGLYYGVAVAGDIAGLEKAAENVPLSRAGADGVTVPVVKPAGGAAFFKVVVSDRAR